MKRILLYIIIPAFLGLPFLAATGFAQNLFPACDGTTVDSAICQEQRRGQTHQDNRLYGPNGVITKVVRIYSIVTGIAAVFVMILAGIKLVLASGDPANVKSAKDTVLFAVIGLIVAALGAAIVQFVLIRL